MYCSNCGNKIEQGFKFCSHCGNKIEEATYNQSNDKEKNLNHMLKEKSYNYIKKQEDAYLKLFETITSFEGAVALQFLIITFTLIEESFSTESGGWQAILSPFIAVICVMPQIVGYILELINKRKNSYILTVLLFITSCLSLIIIINVTEFVTNMVVYAILIIHCCVLIFNYFKKLIDKIKENN